MLKNIATTLNFGAVIVVKRKAPTSQTIKSVIHTSTLHRIEIPVHGVMMQQQVPDTADTQIAKLILVQSLPVLSHCRIITFVVVVVSFCRVEIVSFCMMAKSSVLVVLSSPPVVETTGTSMIMFRNAIELTMARNDMHARSIKYVTDGESLLTTYCWSQDEIIMTDVTIQAKEKIKTEGFNNNA
mmetsp:Transcript_42634/g.102814  ORF Transcript_42634/g.102814 Transcript_42634/m.102814 type:complete len:184 (+) Transcript_42634:2395-2946(+)